MHVGQQLGQIGLLWRHRCALLKRIDACYKNDQTSDAAGPLSAQLVHCVSMDTKGRPADTRGMPESRTHPSGELERSGKVLHTSVRCAPCLAVAGPVLQQGCWPTRCWVMAAHAAIAARCQHRVACLPCRRCGCRQQRAARQLQRAAGLQHRHSALPAAVWQESLHHAMEWEHAGPKTRPHCCLHSLPVAVYPPAQEIMRLPQMQEIAPLSRAGCRWREHSLSI